VVSTLKLLREGGKEMPVTYWYVIIGLALVVGLYQKLKGNNAVQRRRIELEAQRSRGTQNPNGED